MITFINMTVKHNNLLNLIIGCLYVSFFGLHVSVIFMTIIRSLTAKEIAMQQRSLLHGNFFSSYGPDDGHKKFPCNKVLCCMAISLALTDLMMVIRMTETCSPKKLT